MPGNTLYPGLTEPTPLDQIDLTITIGIDEASQFCNNQMIELERYGLLAFTCLFNGCVTLGCAVYKYEDGKMQTCDVYVAWEWLLGHELRHCQGYADRWY